MFVNFSNHPSNKWDDDQLKAAHEYGEVVNVDFPAVAPDGDEAYIRKLADEYAERILELSPQAVMCQGEFTLTFAIVEHLKAAGVLAVAGCSRRDVRKKEVNGAIEKTGVLAVAGCSRRDVRKKEVNGAIEKTTVFHFVRFRSY